VRELIRTVDESKVAFIASRSGSRSSGSRLTTQDGGGSGRSRKSGRGRAPSVNHRANDSDNQSDLT
jgi:hypothetical protein